MPDFDLREYFETIHGDATVWIAIHDDALDFMNQIPIILPDGLHDVVVVNFSDHRDKVFFKLKFG